MNAIWCDGQWLDVLDFPASPADRGVALGLGLFETILAVNGEPVFASRHAARLRNGCDRLGWQPELPDLRGVVVELLDRAGLTEGRVRVRMAVSAGSGRLHDLSLGSDARVWITAVQAAAVPASVTANLSPWPRNERSPLVGLKCTSYAENLVALADAARRGYGETVFANTAGRICEAATANVFIVRDGQVRTPPLSSGCLPGITRGVILEQARRLGIPCAEMDLSPGDLTAADEMFVTSAVRGPVPVSRFQHREIAPGAVTRALRLAWEQAIC